MFQLALLANISINIPFIRPLKFFQTSCVIKELKYMNENYLFLHQGSYLTGVFVLDTCVLQLTFVNKGESRKEERAPWPSPDPKLIVHPIQKPPHQRYVK